MVLIALLLACPFSPRPVKGQFLLLFIFEAPDTFADLKYGQKARDLFPSGNVAMLTEKKRPEMWSIDCARDAKRHQLHVAWFRNPSCCHYRVKGHRELDNPLIPDLPSPPQPSTLFSPVDSSFWDCLLAFKCYRPLLLMFSTYKIYISKWI